MKTIGNILWFVFGGFISGLLWLFAGAACCITVVCIPLGLQCFKFAQLSFWPFGRDVVFTRGAVRTLANIIWIVCCGIWMSLYNLFVGALWCCTIVGIPFGKQFFKIAGLALTPFGAEIIHK